MFVEAAGVAVRTAGPLRAFYERIRARRGMQIAVVATARKVAVLCWHLVIKGEDYAFARPSLTEKKLRSLELRAGLPARRGKKGQGGRVLAQRGPPSRTRARRASRAGLSPARRRPASQAPEDQAGRGRQALPRSLRPF
jgi:hypothetical protein